MTAKLRVPSGKPDQDSCGERSSPPAPIMPLTCGVGSVSPSAQSVLVTVKRRAPGAGSRRGSGGVGRSAMAVSPRRSGRRVGVPQPTLGRSRPRPPTAQTVAPRPARGAHAAPTRSASPSRGSVAPCVRPLGLPDAIRACLFDLDGVLTQTATVHHRRLEAHLRRVPAAPATRGAAEFSQHDYNRYVDGKPRADGVRDFLASRGITLPEGTPDDPPDAATVHGRRHPQERAGAARARGARRRGLPGLGALPARGQGRRAWPPPW